jgi:DNA-directed RNA polymerase subunit RPC12/RpoP
MNTGKTLGIVLVAVGIGICLLAALWIGVSGEGLTRAAMVLGLGIAFIICAPIVGIGVFLLVRGRSEEAQMAEVKQERKLLGMVQAQGQVDIAQAALELDVSRDEIKAMIYDLVNKGFFSGYINWDKGILYSQDASKLKEGSRCPNCGGQLELAGKGVVNCPYCGTEIYLGQ